MMSACFACGERIAPDEVVSFRGQGALSAGGPAIQLHAGCTARVAADLLAALSPAAGLSVLSRPGACRRARQDAGLSGRESAVLRGIVEGRTNVEMAADMGLTVKTVKNVVSTVLFKLEARSRTEAAVAALRRGLVE